MERKSEDKARRRPSIEVRCPGCGTRDVWHHLPKAGDECRWCGHAFEDFAWHRMGPAEGAERAEG